MLLFCHANSYSIIQNEKFGFCIENGCGDNLNRLQMKLSFPGAAIVVNCSNVYLYHEFTFPIFVSCVIMYSMNKFKWV